MKYMKDTIYEGYNINIRIWKYGAEKSGSIVADDIKEERFYESSKKIINTLCVIIID